MNLIKVLFCTLVLPGVTQIGLSHAIPTPVAKGPLRVQGSVIVDSAGQSIPLRGVEMPGLNLANPAAAQLQTVAAMNSITFGTLRLRWNLNTVRLPVSSWIWGRDGQSYLERVGQIVKAANDEGLLVVIADFEDTLSGKANPTGLPDVETNSFWKAWAAYFKDNPQVIFSVFN